MASRWRAVVPSSLATADNNASTGVDGNPTLMNLDNGLAAVRDGGHDGVIAFGGGSAMIADPELTIGLPASVTAWTGMDALSHLLEAWCSPLFHPLGEGIALEGIRMCKEWPPVAVNEGENLNARAFVLAASSMGAIAFQKGLGAMHAMSHPYSSLRGTHHGLTNAVVMLYVRSKCRCN